MNENIVRYTRQIQAAYAACLNMLNTDTYGKEDDLHQDSSISFFLKSLGDKFFFESPMEKK